MLELALQCEAIGLNENQYLFIIYLFKLHAS